MESVRDASPTGGESPVGSGVAETPILEARGVDLQALVALPPPRFSHSSSSGSGSARRRRAPNLRRSQAQDSDPCLLASSLEGWSDEEEKDYEDTSRRRDEAGRARPSVQRSQTDKISALRGVGTDGQDTDQAATVSPVAPLFIRVRKFASTSALDLQERSPSSLQVAQRDTAAPVPGYERERVDIELASVLEEGGYQNEADTRRDNELLKANGRDIDQLKALHNGTSGEGDLPIPAAGPSNQQTRWRFAWIANPRFRRWYGRILNSYFAFWLLVCSLTIALLEVLLLVVLMVLRHEKKGRQPRKSCPVVIKSGLSPIHYIGAAACVLLTLPVIFPVNLFTLYKKRADNRMIRRPYLHICELLVTAEIVYLLYYAITEGYHLRVTIKCHRDFSLAEVAFLGSTFTLWCILWWQLIVFCRFLVHLKLQADAANDATHTSTLSDWLKPPTEGALSYTHEGRRVQRFKKLLYRAAARGDVVAVNELVSDNSVESYGIATGDGVRNLYTRSPTLWFYAFASSSKNPLHIAAKRGHVEIVSRLLEIGFDANSLDKVARINFNLGLLFKIVTRLLFKTQDGSKSPLRAVLCSVLLPPLHGAVAAGHVDVVRVLLDKGGADPNVLPRVSFYYPSAAIPAIFLADDPEIVKMLVSRGANFLHVATTALSGLASSSFATPLQRSALTQRSATTEYLLSCGGDVALTPLHEAAAADNIRKVRRLLRQRPHHVNESSTIVDSLGERVKGVQQRTPLHWAAVVGRFATAKLLLESGANPNSRDRYGRTPLHWAARNNHGSVVTLLLDHGADATAEDDAGIPVLSFAAEAEGVELQVFSSLLDHGASLKFRLPGSGDTPLHTALQRENRETAKSLIRCGADLMASNNEGKRAVDVTTSTKLQFELKKEAGTRDIMISYPHSHFALAHRLREYLETHGKLTCWMDTMDPSGIGGGAVWREEIARGIHNSSLVVSLVCGGYTKSEWCLKELAFAKMIRKPVVALMVESPVGTDSSEADRAESNTFEALVPPENRLTFSGVLRSSRATHKLFDSDIDAIELESSLHSVLPKIKNAMKPTDQNSGRWPNNRSQSPNCIFSQKDSEPERENEDEGDHADDERSIASISINQASASTVTSTLSVVVCSTIASSVLRDRMVQELSQFDFVCCRPLVISNRPSDSLLYQELAQCRVLVIVIESLGSEATREERHEVSTQLTQLLRIAASGAVGSSRLRVFPIVARDEFLSFSNLYTLAQSDLLYYVNGVQVKQSTATLLRQLRRAADHERKRRMTDLT